MGSIDEFAWLQGALSALQVREIMENGLAAFETFPGKCGDEGTEYLAGDLNMDCYVDANDLDILADRWLETVAP